MSDLVQEGKTCVVCGGKATQIIASLINVKYYCDMCLAKITRPWWQQQWTTWGNKK